MKSLMIKVAVLMVVSILLFLLTTDILLWRILRCPDAQHPPQNIGKYAPSQNLHPKYYLILQGKIDPKLNGKHHLKWVMVYQTTNNACQYDASGGAEGVYTPRMTTVEQTIQVDQQNHYFYKLPLDYYKSEFCGWVLSNAILVNGQKPFSDSDHLINLIFKSNPTENLLRAEQNSNREKSYYNFQCNENGCNDRQHHRLAIVEKLSRQEKLSIHVNFYYRNSSDDNHS